MIAYRQERRSRRSSRSYRNAEGGDLGESVTFEVMANNGFR